MPKVALVETKPSRTNFTREFDNAFEFDQYQLCSDPTLKKVLKRDCDISINTDEYDWVVLVGSDALKYFTKINSVTEYSGKKVEGKFLPVINPAMLAFKPEAKKTWDSSKENIIAYINGEIEDVIIDEKIAMGTQDTEVARAWIDAALAAKPEYLALDSETNGLYPRNGHMIGISMSYTGKDGIYIDTDCFDEDIEEKLGRLFKNTKVIFHNAKFDMAFFEYHFGFEFPDFEDTMLLHYLIDENPGGHGLKQLSIKFTPYGDYEKPMYDWIDQYKRANGYNQESFSWDMIPFDVMKTYAAMDAVCTFLLYEKFVKIKQNPKLKWVYDHILIPGCRFLMDAQDNGVPFDRMRLLVSQGLMQDDIDAAINQLYEVEAVREFEKAQGKDFNPNSTVQLRSLLFDYIGLQPTGKKTGTGANSTDAEVLQQLAGDVRHLRLVQRVEQVVQELDLREVAHEVAGADAARRGGALLPLGAGPRHVAVRFRLGVRVHPAVLRLRCAQVLRRIEVLERAEGTAGALLRMIAEVWRAAEPVVVRAGEGARRHRHHLRLLPPRALHSIVPLVALERRVLLVARELGEPRYL